MSIGRHLPIIRLTNKDGSHHSINATQSSVLCMDRLFLTNQNALKVEDSRNHKICDVMFLANVRLSIIVMAEARFEINNHFILFCVVKQL